MSDPEDKTLERAVVCEINTAPTLTSTTYVAERWSMYFNHLINSNVRVEDWDFEQFQKANSLAWKNEQFNI
jgi:hypothetical protein